MATTLASCVLLIPGIYTLCIREEIFAHWILNFMLVYISNAKKLCSLIILEKRIHRIKES